MKRRIKNLFLALAAGTLLLQSSCIGSFNLTNSLYNWNNSLGDKWVNALVFAGFVIVPVYGATLFIDGIILNTIEFWGGSNPISMKEGEMEQQIITRNGATYKITAVKNKFITEQIEGPAKGQIAEFEFVPQEKCWYLNMNGKHKKLVEVNELTGETIVFMPNGDVYAPEMCLKF